MSDLKKRIIALIKKNRISTVEVADALDKTGVIEGPKSLSGENLLWVRSSTFTRIQVPTGLSMSRAKKSRKEEFLYVDSFNCGMKAIFGDIVAKYFVLYKSVHGVVVNGLLRDVHTLVKEDFPMWCLGTTPLGCSNKNISVPDDVVEQAKQRREFFEGGIMICDDSGCTFIQKDKITEDTYRRLEFIELQEDIWYYCIDTLKWSTYKQFVKSVFKRKRRFACQS